MLMAQNLTCIRGERRLFESLGFELKAGGLLYVLGENGSGKTSLLRLLCGFLRPEEGAVFWRGENITQDQENYCSSLLYLGHLNGLKDDLTALENLQMSARLSGYEADEPMALAALAAIKLQHCANLPVRVLSQGQKRRVALARLWLTDRQLWILDEPFTALDAASVEILTARLSQHMANGGITIMTTHQNVSIGAQFTETLRLNS
jgi:heme exporter protein A